MFRFPISGFRFLISAALLVPLAACGFHPLYGKIGGKSADVTFQSIYVEAIPERVGYQLRSNLLDLFDAPSAPQGAMYRLRIELRSDEKGLALEETAAVTRYSYRLAARYRLTRAGSTDVLKKGVVYSLTSYDVVQSPYATVVAERDAQDRAAQDIAERLRTELAVYFINAQKAAP
ncbi:MAG: LPS assembly lipoprotein LptE [Alphaproteobacteria bacterium]